MAKKVVLDTVPVDAAVNHGSSRALSVLILSQMYPGD